MAKLNQVLLLLVVSLSLVACASNKKDDYFAEIKPQDKPKVKNITSLKNNWSLNMSGDIQAGESDLSPVLLADSVYAAAPNGRVYKVDAQNGKPQWRVDLDVEVSAGVHVGGGLVLLGTPEGEVIALYQDSGKEAWRAQVTSEILASPVGDNEIVVVRSIDGRVHGLSSNNGELEWTISRQLPRLTLRGDSKPLLTQGVAFIGFADGTFAALDSASGRALWDFPISFASGRSEIERLADVDTNPLIVGNKLYVSSYQDTTHSVNVVEQKVEWTAELSTYNEFAYDAASLYLTDRQGVVHRLDRTTGEVLWSQEALKHRVLSTPVSIGPFLLFADDDGDIFVLDKRDGSFAGRHNLGAERIIGSPESESDTIYFIDSDGSLRSLSLINKN
jgi:outer membrane protein assembly factor BamB